MGRSRKPPKGKKIRPTFFVFCEGKTEELYIKFLKSEYRVSIEIDSKKADHSISEKYIKNYKNTKFTHEKDKTFLLYDIDVQKILKKLQTIKGSTLLVSNPCIELWYLLHYKEQKAEIDCKKCNEELDKRNNGYSKNLLDNKLKENLKNKQNKAINRAKKLETFKNPCSKVYLLLEALEEVRKGNF